MSRAITKDELRDDQWEKLEPFIPGGGKGERGPRSENRPFMNAVLWVARSGGQWDDLPGCFGKSETVKRRYYRFIERGVFDAMFAAVSDDADLEWLMIDSTTIRALQQAAGARKVKGGLVPQGLGPSRGGLTTKIHAATDALGNPVRLIGGPGQQHDIARAEELIDGIKAGAVIADKGYDANKLEAKIAERGSEVVIPPKRNRKAPRSYDKDLYKERDLIERLFAKLKQFRRVATRYDKLLINYMGFVKLAAIVICLR